MSETNKITNEEVSENYTIKKSFKKFDEIVFPLNKSVLIPNIDNSTTRLLEIDFNGNFYVVSNSSDSCLLKYDSNGDLLLNISFPNVSINDFLQVRINALNEIFVVINTNYPGLPVVGNHSITLNASWDAYITRIHSNGTIIYGTYIGGSDFDFANNFIIDSFNNVYIVGETLSNNFPTHNAINNTLNGLTDVFLTKLSSNGELAFSSYFGGLCMESGVSIALDSDNNIIFVGRINAISPNNITIPLKNASIETPLNLFLVKLSENYELLISTFFGGEISSRNVHFPNIILDLKVDQLQNIFLVGTAKHDILTKNALDKNLADSYCYGSYCSMTDGFISKFDKNLNLVFSTYLGNDDIDEINDFLIDENNDLYLTGYTKSSSFPRIPFVENSYKGKKDIFFSKITSNGSLIFSFIIGGNDNDISNKILISGDNKLFLFGSTSSNDFPLINSNNLPFSESYFAITMSNLTDYDNDKMIDIWEEMLGLNPNIDDAQEDNDSDGMPNLWEYQMGLNINLNDSLSDYDNDNLKNIEEYQLKSSPTTNDSDFDGMDDYWEVMIGTNITDYDAYEDYDNDTIYNIIEYSIGWNPFSLDSDNDGMPDEFESKNTFFPPCYTFVDLTPEGDLDGDGMPNLWEYQMGLMVTDARDKNRDLDGDGMPNLWEYQMGLNASYNDANEDLDDDGMPNLWEFQMGLNASFKDGNIDTDGDWISNYEEYKAGTDPNDRNDFPLLSFNYQVVFSLSILGTISIIVGISGIYVKKIRK